MFQRSCEEVKTYSLFRLDVPFSTKQRRYFWATLKRKALTKTCKKKPTESKVSMFVRSFVAVFGRLKMKFQEYIVSCGENENEIKSKTIRGTTSNYNMFAKQWMKLKYSAEHENHFSHFRKIEIIRFNFFSRLLLRSET